MRKAFRQIAVALLTVLTLIAPAARSTDAAERGPNVILVMTDDQGYGDLSCHGNPVLKTPNLDRLHKDSVRLTNYHVDPTCSPTRAALLTGRYSCRTGVWHTIMGRSLLRRDEVTVADLFSKAGYKTGIFGKWHLGDNYPFLPQYRGFQETLIHGGGGIGQTPDVWGNDYFDDVYFKNGKKIQAKGYCTKVFFDGALDFIEKNKDEPFFCYIPTNVPHGPYLVADKYSEPFRKLGIKGVNANFYGMLTEFDENFGRLLDTLTRLELDKNTIVIFTTDNGTAGGHFNEVLAGGAKMRGRKGSEFDGGHHVPFFARWLGKWKGGRDLNHLTAHIDVLPTLADACGLEIPKGRKIDGKSLSSLLEGGDVAWAARTLFVQSHRIEIPKPWRKSSVLTDRWRLVNGEMLFDVLADPGQQKNVKDQHPAVYTDLRKQYESWYADVSKSFPGYCRIIVGSPTENPTLITCHDWHGQRVPWHQNMVRKTMVANGFWAIDVEEAGRYAFTLRTRPSGDDSYKFEKGTASVQVGTAEAKAEIAAGSSEVTLELTLPKGKAKLQTTIEEGSKKPRGAFFVKVERK